MDSRYIRKMQARTAEAAITNSALRNQGSAGVITAARKYLSKMDLKGFYTVHNEEDFRKLLDKKTKSLASRFPGQAKGNWGAARKAINIFLRDCLYNRYLATEFNLERLESLFEIPLDRDVGKCLRKMQPTLAPSWNSIKGLEHGISQEFQKAAAEQAKQEGISRVHLDLLFWRNAKKCI